tara:strand:- start:344 stop:2008 length:1665 start_codon:yes stop_codon:yes gene_type:complete
MTNFFILFLFYLLIIFSIIGYGNIFSLISSRTYSIGEKGLNGILFLIIISYITNFFTPHSIYHNLIVISIGLFAFVTQFIKKLKNNIKELKVVFLVFLILFIGLLMHKNHDDFFYYHFSYTLSIIEYKKIIGLGMLNHGFRTPSSIFYLNSLFYLPFIKYFLINSGVVFVMGFSNLVFLDKIFNQLKNKTNFFVLFLIVFSFVYINVAFYRIAEHGTDKSALILIFLLVITYFESLSTLKKKITYNSSIIYYEKIIVLLLLIISLKSFYLIYITLFLLWLYQFRSFIFYEKKIFKVLTNKFTFLFVLGVSLFVIHVFLNTSCLVYPASFTCFENFQWSIPINKVEQMKSWYSLWSKGGANPTFRVENPTIYLANFNWVPRWFSDYFFTKISDTILIIFLVSLICSLLLKGKEKNKNYFFDKNYIPLILILSFLFLIWFVNHPALRYGGYAFFGLMFFIPISNFLAKKFYSKKRLKKRINILIIVAFSIFVIKNITRLQYENNKYQYDLFINPYFNLDEKNFNFQKILSELNYEYRKDHDSYYLILNYKIIKDID